MRNTGAQGRQGYTCFLRELPPVAGQNRVDRIAPADLHRRYRRERGPEHRRDEVLAWRKAAVPSIIKHREVLAVRVSLRLYLRPIR